jgi:hypothetical protein
MKPTDRTTYTLVLRPLSGPAWRTTGTQRLRILLKIALRSFGLRAESVIEQKEETK